jgi:DNA repair exonuclease SbcCD nuclease subunit
MDLGVIGDLHLEKLTSLMPDDRDWVGVQLDIFSGIIERMLSDGITTCVQLGDIVDGPYPEKDTLSRFFKVLSKYPQMNFYFQLGNHDIATREDHSMQITNSVLEIGALSHVKIFSKATKVTIEEIPFVFLPWPSHQTFKLPKSPHVIFGHFPVMGCVGDNGRKLEGENLKGKHYWILGDIHKRQLVKKNILYTGTPMQLGWAEEVNKGYYTFEIWMDKKLRVKPTYHPLDNPYRLEIKTISKAGDFPKYDPKVYYRLYLDENIALPDDFLVKNPNASINGGGKAQKFEEVVENDSEWNQIKALRKWLKPKLDRHELGKAISLAREMGAK